MIVWFLAIGAVRRRRASPTTRRSSRRCRRPTRSDFLFGHFSTAFFALAAVVLAITGAEALYADMGHFGRAPITRAWLLLVFPACILSYMGQGALILDDPDATSRSPFFLLVPDWGRLADGLPGHRRDGDRLAGGDHRRLLGRPPGRPARLPAAAAHRAHLGADGRPDLRPVDQLAADGLGADPRVRVRDARPRWPSRSAWRSPARSRSPRSCSSTSRATSGESRCGWWLLGARRSC